VRRRHVFLALSVFIACGPQKVAVDPAIAARAMLADADASLQAGCFDCLVDALKHYESARAVPAVAEIATAGAVRASALLALRERELGATDSGYLEHARGLADGRPAIQMDVASQLEIIEAMPWRAGAGRSGRPDSALTVYTDRAQRIASLRSVAARDELAAYLWVAYACESGAGLSMGHAELKAPLGAMAEQPLIAYRLAICPTGGTDLLDAVIAEQPRFKEAAFYKGLRASSARRLDDADARYREAYAWRPTWPAATLAIANVAMSAEEFDQARAFYEETLTLAPLYPDALLGKLRALTYLATREDAMRVADQLLGIGRYPGDAHYWKAYNELQLDRYDAAWSDIDEAERSMINSDVPKLAGIIAINRQQFDVARQKLELSRQRNPNDCQTLYYLHLVLAEQRQWPETVRGAVTAAGCIDAAATGLRSEIETIRESDAPAARKARQIAAREQQIASGLRMRATCWFNAGVGSFNLSKADDAREFAERVADDEQFGERARQLLARLK
jgi:tetratricopeptide (TPR) repeat protein